jgi:hypothetical protein
MDSSRRRIAFHHKTSPLAAEAQDRCRRRADHRPAVRLQSAVNRLATAIAAPTSKTVVRDRSVTESDSGAIGKDPGR